MRPTLRFLTLIAALGAVSTAFAQDPQDDAPPEQVFVDPGEEEYVEEEYVDEQGQYVEEDPAYQGEVVEVPGAHQDPQYQDPSPPERLGRQLSLALDVPIFLTNASDVGPGVGAHLRFGWEFGMIVPQIKLGVATNFLSESAEVFTGAANVNSLWVTLGARLQILNRTRFVPVIDAGLRLQFWNYPAGLYTEQYVFEPGVTIGVGLAIEITARFGLEVGVDGTLTFPTSDTFAGFPDDGAQFFLAPHVGGTFYF